jgi:hypothetical protein
MMVTTATWLSKYMAHQVAGDQKENIKFNTDLIEVVVQIEVREQGNPVPRVRLTYR